MNDFNLEEEIICDYTVSKEMKKVWKIQLDMLKKFMEVCDKHGLKYFLTAGSMLGAVRHNGFIPWDDDIDIGMLRDDYNKLLEIADKEFKYPYFFQTPYNDNIYRGHAQLRNSETTAILPHELGLEFNQGIFMDIFPYDGIPNNKILYKIQKNKIKNMVNIMSWYKCYNPNLKNSITMKIKKVFSNVFFKFVNYKKFYAHFEKVCSKYSSLDDVLVSNLSLIYDRPKYQHNKKYFEELFFHKFENLSVPIPKEYDKILSKQYGNYMEFKKGTATHGCLILNPDISYKKYILEGENSSEKV